MKKIYVVIPNWNGADLITACLDSVIAQRQKASIVVVDNGSVDESISIIESRFPEVTLIKLPVNTGFAGGVNVGIRYALEHNADAVALLNNDAVADSNWLRVLTETMDKDLEIGISTGKILRMDKKHFDSAGSCYSIWGMPFPRGRNQLDNGQFDSIEPVFGGSGGASLYRASMLEQIGLFDERFFAYYEDDDINFRAQLSKWQVVYNYHAVVYHHVSATSSKLYSFTHFHATKNFYMLYQKNMPGILYFKYLPLFVAQAVGLCISSILKGNGKSYFSAVWKVILGLTYILRDRRQIQKSSLASSAHINSILYKHRPPVIPKL